MPPASTKAWTASRRASHSRFSPRPTTTTTAELGADPVHLMYALEQSIRREQLPDEVEKRHLEFIKAELVPRYAEFIGHEIQKAYLESYSDYGQNLFDRYVDYADAWIEDQDFKDPDTGQLLNRNLLNQELTKIEKPAGITTRRTSATRSSSSRCGRGHRTAAKTRPGPAMKRFEKSSRNGYFRRSKTFFRLSRLARKRTAIPKRSTASCRAHGGTRLYRASGSPPRRMVHAGEASRLRQMQGWLCTSSIGA